MDISANFLNIFPSLIKGIQGLTLLSDGASMESQGADLAAGAFRSAGTAALQGGIYSAGVYRNSSKAVQATTAYNIQLDKNQQAIQDDILSRQITSLFAKNTAVQGQSGFSTTSKSFLSVQASALDSSARTINQNAANAKQRQDNINYQGLLSEMTLENQARNAEYQGKVSQVNYENQARQAEYQGEVANYQAGVKSAQSVGGLVTSVFDAFK